ncbi:ABC transporter substrate-binding protein, partial [Escherichia coli]|uniref:ABC transporter substrate-binding protein n=1 Tax=Escherichia coli TaxID=562 RepID=UPI00207B0F2B
MNIKGKALLAGCIALAFSNMALAEDIKVAVVGAMSGPVAQYGDQEFTGAEQAVSGINGKGGIKSNKLQIVKYEDACDPKQAGWGGFFSNFPAPQTLLTYALPSFLLK